MRTRLFAILAGMACVAASSALGAAAPASAMGSGNPYEDLQVGVTYTVYQPARTAGLTLAHQQVAAECMPGEEQNVGAAYGTYRGTYLVLTEGNPVCSDPGGDGRRVGTYRVQGAIAHLEVFCDPADAAQWKACSPGDLARFGGDLSFTLPGHGNLRATDIVVLTMGAKPLPLKRLLAVARGLTPVAADPSLVGGMVTCTQAAIGDAVAAGMPKGQVLVSVDSFRCADGWAYVFATTGDGRGHDIGQTFVLQAEGQFWIPKDRSKVCGTTNLSSPATRPADAQVPASLWLAGCNSN